LPSMFSLIGAFGVRAPRFVLCLIINSPTWFCSCDQHLLAEVVRTLRAIVSQIFAFAGSHRNGVVLDFFVADNHKKGNLVNCVLADFKADLLVSQVSIHPKAQRIPLFREILAIFPLIVGDIEDGDLCWGQPAGGMRLRILQSEYR